MKTGNRLFSRGAPWLLVALVLAMALPGIGSLPLVDRDEPRFATATREMMQRADWIVPTFNGHDRFDKPVLTYWLMRVGYSIFGFTELGARLHAVAATIALVLVTWWMGRRWFGERAGFLAAMMLATCLQVFIHGRLALADMPMVACVVLACLALKELLDQSEPRPFRNRWWWLLYLALGLGFLAKGPIVFAVPLLALILFRWAFWRKPLAWKRLGLAPGLVLTSVIIASWGVPALVATHGLFWKVGMNEHVIQRGFDRFNGRGYSPFFYLATAPMSLFPWIACIGFLPLAWTRFWNERTAWLTSWLAAPYVIFTFYATQLPHYVLPAFPAFFLLISQVLGGSATTPLMVPRRIAGCLLGGSALILLAALFLVDTSTLPMEIEPLRSGLTGMVGVLLGFILLTAFTLLERPWSVFPPLVFIMLGGAQMGRSLRETSLTASSSEWVAGLPADAHCVGAGFSEPSLVFYSGRTWDFLQDAAELEKSLNAPGNLVVVTLVDEVDPLQFFRAGLEHRFGREPKPVVYHAGSEEVSRLMERFTQAGGWAIRDVAGFNLGRTRWQRVRVWIRRAR